PDQGAGRGRAAALPVLLAIAACVAFFHPFCYYPDVDTHGRFLQALRDNPSLLVDPTQPWQRRGDVTREIGGQKIPIPYAMVFHAAAWPLSPLLGDTGALKTVAVIAAAAVVLLARRLAHLDGARDGAAALTFVLIAEAAYTGSLLTVSALVLALSAVLALSGEWRRALRLSIGWAIATA